MIKYKIEPAYIKNATFRVTFTLKCDIFKTVNMSYYISGLNSPCAYSFYGDSSHKRSTFAINLKNIGIKLLECDDIKAKI